jgi:hypothetical protein
VIKDTGAHQVHNFVFFDRIKFGGLKWRWYWSRARTAKVRPADPLLALYGSGREVWADEHADDYVARLRGGCDSNPQPPNSGASIA